MESIQRPVYTDDERIRRVWDKEEIQNLMGRRAYYDANGMRRRELDELWVAKPENRATASLGRNWGYYVGMDSISAYYVARHDEARWENLRRYSQAKPEIRCCAENLGYGCMSMYTVTTPVVVIAGDGKTARGLWYSMAQETTGNPDGSAEALWICEKQAVDFINEDGQWKIWHFHMYRLPAPPARYLRPPLRFFQAPPPETVPPSHSCPDMPKALPLGSQALLHRYCTCRTPESSVQSPPGTALPPFPPAPPQGCPGSAGYPP